MKILDKKQLVMIGIRKRGKWGFNIKSQADSLEKKITLESKFNKEDIHRKTKSG